MKNYNSLKPLNPEHDADCLYYIMAHRETQQIERF